jgi:ADP-ribose pyrophosphatase YjhB (NUDIX family)
MTPAQQLALWADQLRDISAGGLRYASTIYEQERFHQVQEVALRLLGMATGDTLGQLEPLRAPVFSRPTPLAVGDAAIIDDAGRILLIQRADNGLWAMPGGALEVGETPAAGAAREALEESGVHCEPVALVGVFDSRFCGTASRHHLYQFLFLCRPVAGTPAEIPSHGHETLGSGWFREEELPDALDPGHVTRIPLAFRCWRGELPAFFDR